MNISFTTQNWRKAVLDKMRPGRFVRKHFEAMVFTHLAEELRADWSEQLLAWEDIQEKLAEYLVEVGLCEEGEVGAFDAASFRRQLDAGEHADEECQRRVGCGTGGRSSWRAA